MSKTTPLKSDHPNAAYYAVKLKHPITVYTVDGTDIIYTIEADTETSTSFLQHLSGTGRRYKRAPKENKTKRSFTSKQDALDALAQNIESQIKDYEESIQAAKERLNKLRNITPDTEHRFIKIRPW